MNKSKEAVTGRITRITLIIHYEFWMYYLYGRRSTALGCGLFSPLPGVHSYMRQSRLVFSPLPHLHLQIRKSLPSPPWGFMFSTYPPTRALQGLSTVSVQRRNCWLGSSYYYNISFVPLWCALSQLRKWALDLGDQEGGRKEFLRKIYWWQKLQLSK